MKLDSIDHVAFTVRDIEKSTEWYTNVFDMTRIYEDVWTGQGDPVALCNGTACVALFRNRRSEVLPAEPEQSGRHFAFKVDAENFELMKERLASLGIATRVRDHRVCTSLYLNDPDGNEIELTYYYRLP